MFISVDPLVGLTRQPYIYAGGNPVSYSDPSGLSYGCGENGCIDDFDSIYAQQFTAYLNQDAETNAPIADIRSDYGKLPEHRASDVRSVIAGARKAFEENHFNDGKPFSAMICTGSDLGCLALVGGAMAATAGAAFAIVEGGAVVVAKGVVTCRRLCKKIADAFSDDPSSPVPKSAAGESGPDFSIDSHISDNMEARGWTEESIGETIADPAETHDVWDYTTGLGSQRPRMCETTAPTSS